MISNNRHLSGLHYCFRLRTGVAQSRIAPLNFKVTAAVLAPQKALSLQLAVKKWRLCSIRKRTPKALLDRLCRWVPCL